MIIDTGHHDFLVTDGTSALLGRSPGHLGLFLAHAGSSSLGRERLISATPQAEHTFTSILLGRSVLQAEYLASFVQESSHGEKGGSLNPPAISVSVVLTHSLKRANFSFLPEACRAGLLQMSPSS